MNVFRVTLADGRRVAVMADHCRKNGKVEFINDNSRTPVAVYRRHEVLMIEDATPSHTLPPPDIEHMLSN